MPKPIAWAIVEAVTGDLAYINYRPAIYASERGAKSALTQHCHGAAFPDVKRAAFRIIPLYANLPATPKEPLPHE